MLAKFHMAPKRKKRRLTTAGTAVSPRKEPTFWLLNPDGSLVDWRNEDQVRAKVYAQSNENWNQPSDYIESRVLAWIRELELIGAIALEGNGEKGSDYNLAAKSRLSLIKL